MHRLGPKDQLQLRGTAIFVYNMNSIKEIAKKIITITKEDLTKATGKEDPVVTIAIGFDGTKVTQCLTFDHAHKAMVGGVFPDHFIDFGDKTSDELKTLLDTKSSIVQAKEVKLCVMSVYQPGVRKIPTSSLGAFLQEINSKSSLNQQNTNVLLDLCRESNYCIRHVSVAADGMSFGERWIMSHLTAFLRGESIFAAVVDTNHSTKNDQSQTYHGYSSVVFMGFHVVDCVLYIISGVALKFWRVKYWESELLPLGLAPAGTVVNITHLAAIEDTGTVSIMCESLFFMRLKLFAVKAKKCGWQETVVFSWFSMILLSSLTSKSRLGTNQNNSRKNVRSTLTETIVMVFYMAGKDIVAPGFLTTEPNEHKIA